MSNREVGNESSEEFHILQPNRDLESNWEVDLAKKLEDYLLKICSGEIVGDEDGHLSVNFAEAALMIQGSIQVYSRKVEYLYSLVLHALEFLSQKRQDQQENTSTQPEESDFCPVNDRENEKFLDLDDVLVEAKNCLDDEVDAANSSTHFVKPPANLLVLEGDCLDTTGEAGELESYLLATSDLYEDFLLLDQLDAGAIYDFLQESSKIGPNLVLHGSSVRSKTRRSSFQSPLGRTGGTAHKSNNGKTQEDNLNQTSGFNIDFNDNNMCSEPHIDDRNLPESTSYHGEDLNNGFSEPSDDSDDDDEDDPWMPLNPHEPGDLKVKPFRKGKICRQGTGPTKQNPVSSQFPLAKLDSPVLPEFSSMLKPRFHNHEESQASQSLPLFEKLRRSLVFGDSKTVDFNMCESDNEDIENDLPDFEQDEGFQDTARMDADVTLPDQKQNEDNINFDGNESFHPEDPCSQASLEDLCCSHLDALLASMAETEKQTELAARVLTWKQGIEQAMEEQDSHPPFDIHCYGQRVLDKLSLEASSEGCMSFGDVVSGQADYDVARTFSALLQLVNNRNVDLERGAKCDGKSICYTAANPFSVRLLKNTNKQQELGIHHSSRKRLKSPLRRAHLNTAARKKLPVTDLSSLEHTSPKKASEQPNGKLRVKLGKSGVIRCTPEGKRRRRSLVEQVDMQFAR